jgi:hypothetical protein
MSTPSRWARRIGLAVGIFVGAAASGCAALQRGGRDPVERSLRRADALYKKRAEPGQLEAALQAYLDALGIDPDDTRVLGRLARSYVLRADLDSADPLTDYGTAREFGLRCLSLQPAFSGQVASAGGRVTPKAVAQIQGEQLDCLRWTSIAWSRLALARGPGMSLDFAAIDALGARTLALSGNDNDGTGALARGLSLAVVPRVMGPDLDGALQQLRVASSKAPDRLSRQVDLAVYGLHRVNKAEARAVLEAVVAAELSPDAAEAAEDRAARARARRRLGLPVEALPGEGLPDEATLPGEAALPGEGLPVEAALPGEAAPPAP